MMEKYLKESGFQNIHTEKYFIEADLQDLFLYSGKFNPNLYLQASIRKGISSFADLANKAEVERGLLALKADIQSGKWEQIKNQYDNQMGDYLYIIAKKLE